MLSNKAIQEAKRLIQESDGILIGAGSGLSAAGGLNYGDPKYFQTHYPGFSKYGVNTLWECVVRFWEVNEQNILQYYAFWATHINNIRYQTEGLQIYKDLYNLIKDKNYFVATTNTDGQFSKSGFDTSKIFAMQGDYMNFQCSVPCRQEVYNNYEMVQKMLKNMNRETLTIQESDIPRCPHCGHLLVPNLRKDDLFVEKPNFVNYPNYINFLKENENKKLVLLELGVGFNSPGALRIPFEKFAYSYPNWKFIRINQNDPQFYFPIENRSIVIQKDLNSTIQELIK
ncbi:NAD-dependent protein deacetylase, SIR2 family [Histomonas meleagridis]|uniref:NAD-dependent protein deacetylase, SIR2 family n=1 Tax=Histomonas meleagridis TaxID=135588 RepID=UPI00355A7448|nr:NAD-dependent protein deacetylase, SIR2 family [Histomonas meleagridis]KAH0805115.1 NAD-dependent protein deacetylase, SIR2 family [Histomonas meleagridis]